MQAVFTKSLNTLRPASSEAEDLLKKIKLGAEVVVEIKRPRNLRWFRLWWVTMQVVSHNLEGNHSAESICDFIKLKIGHVNVYEINGEVIQTPKSISFAAMNQTEWEAFYEQAIEFICSVIIPGLDSDDLKNEVLVMIR